MNDTASISNLNNQLSSTGEQLAITILMPCLNEAETLGACIEKAQHSLKQSRLSGEVLVADNGSTDGSVAIALRSGARVVHVEERGYGSALRNGIDAARGKWIVMGDADDSYDFANIDAFVEKLGQGFELVMGCRMPSGGGKIMGGAMPWKHRWLGNPVLSWIGRLFFRCPVHDFHCGLRALSKDAYNQMDLRTTGMEFASEMVIKAALKQMKVSEVPITLHKDGRSRPPHLRSWRDGWRHLRFMLLFSPTWLFLIPGLLLLLLGTVVGLRLAAGPIYVGRIGFDTNTLLLCAMSVILGVQICLFAIFTRVFAMTVGLLPVSDRATTLFRLLTLERGLLLSLLVLLVGILLLFEAMLYWKQAEFGPISYPASLRKVVPAVTTISLGVQGVFSSFFLSILGLSRR